MTRICITGSPRTGKTTLAKRLGVIPIKHTDDHLALGWSECSLHCSYWFDDSGPFCAEGVAIVRSLRKWLDRNSVGRPCDQLIVLWAPFTPLSKGQHAMAKGVETVLNEIRGELLRRGVEIVESRVLGGVDLDVVRRLVA
jgi:hypothetical protein